MAKCYQVTQIIGKAVIVEQPIRDFVMDVKPLGAATMLTQPLVAVKSFRPLSGPTCAAIVIAFMLHTTI